MKINLSKIYMKDVGINYDCDNRDEYEAKYTKRQRDMWTMTLWLLKDNYPKDTYDDKNPKDMEYLRGYHRIFVSDDQFTHFTLSDWFYYMWSQQ